MVRLTLVLKKEKERKKAKQNTPELFSVVLHFHELSFAEIVISNVASLLCHCCLIKKMYIQEYDR